jgi:hypothetical protein
MDISKIRIDPEFVNMCIRTLQGEQSIHDVLTKNVEASMAHVLQLAAMRERNDHFIAQICRAHLFQAGLVACLTQVSKAESPDDKRAIFAVFVAQAILIGIHMHEQLLDKAAKGLVKV